MITAVNGNLLVEPIMQTDIKHQELEARMKKSGLAVPTKAATDNKSNFEGVPNQGYIRYLPEGYSGELKVDMRIVFSIKSPQGFKLDDIQLIPVKPEEIAAIIQEGE